MENPHKQMAMSWARFATMIGLSVLIMFGLMYQLVYEWDHVFFSLNRLIASLVMGGVMTCLMLGFMWSMYKGKTAKMVVLISGAVVAVGLLWVNRSQALIDDSGFMRSMIPHHSIAINNARKAHLSDPRVRALADRIIEGQIKEIEEMKMLLKDLGKNGPRGQTPLPPAEARPTKEMWPEIQKAVQ